MDSNLIKDAAHLCGAIYGKDKYGFEPLDLPNSKFKRKIYGQYKVFKLFTVKVEGFMLYRDNQLFIIFQGAYGLADWFSNFIFMFAAPISGQLEKRGFLQGVKLNYGFLNQYKAIRPQIRTNFKQISETHGNPKEIIVAGHSLGGALSNMCALDIASLIKKRVHLITFGAPKLGNQKFKELHKEYLKCSFRFVNGNEYIPSLVPFPMYEHTAEKIQLGKRKFPWISFFDHGMDRVWKGLCEWFEKENQK